MMIITRYLIKDLAKSMFGIILFLLLILISSRLIQILSKAVAGKLPSEIVLSLLALSIPDILAILLPIGFALGILLTFNRLSAQHELEVMYASGVSQRRITAVVLTFALVMSLVTASITLWFNPVALTKQKQMIAVYNQSLLTSLITPGQFQKIPGQQLQGVAYTEGFNAKDKELTGFFVAIGTKQTPETDVNLILAKSAKQTTHPNGEQSVRLTEGVRYEGQIGELELQMTEFDALDISINVNEAAYKKRRNQTPSALLFQSAEPKDQAELVWRLSMPLTVPVLVFLVLPICRVGQRKERQYRILATILLILTYFITLIIVQSWIEKSAISSWLGFIGLHGIFLTLGLVLSSDKLMWRWQSLQNKTT